MPGVGWPIGMARKRCDESIGSRTHFVILNLDLSHEFNLRFEKSKFEKAVSHEREGGTLPSVRPYVASWNMVTENMCC